MSTVRRQKARHLKNSDGITICSCGCGLIPKPPRRNWFSNACVEWWRERNDPGYIRQQVLKRDKGICAECRLDCCALQKSVRHAKEVLRAYQPDTHARKFRKDGNWNKPFLCDKYERCLTIWQRWKHKRLQAARNRLERFRAQGWCLERKTFWDADHEIPVVEGGGGCGLENYRTLCTCCHKAATRALAKRRAERRREAKVQA